MKVAVVAEFYPSRRDPVLGIWTHRQALATRDAGADVHVLVLHRVVPPRSSLERGVPGALSQLAQRAREPLQQVLDGLPVSYLPYVSPARQRSYPSWGAWAAPALALGLQLLHRSFPFDIVHAHNAVPAGDAVRRAFVALPHLRVPLVVSVHGGDVLYTAGRYASGAAAVARGLSAARLVLANSHGIAELSRRHGARDTQVVHLGSDLPSAPLPPRADGPPALVTVAHLIPRKRHADVLRALEGLAARLGVAARVQFHGQLAPARAIEQARRATLFVMPSTEEAFGAGYVEAMAGGVPAIGCRGEPGPEEIAAAGDGLVLVPPGDIERLSQRIDELLRDPHRLREAGQRARETVAANFTWERCASQTIAAYERALR